MNQKVLIGIIIALVLILGIMTGLYISKINTSKPESISQPAPQPAPVVPPVTTTEPQPITTPITTPQINPLTYANTDYGFQITFPVGWENYKVNIDNKQVATTGAVYIHFLIPTTDKTYLPAILSNGDKLKGYADVIAITAWNKSEWDKEINSTECKTNPNPGCPYEGSKLGASAKYVFDISHGNGIFPDDTMSKITDLFKKTGSETTGQSVAQKLDFKLLP